MRKFIFAILTFSLHFGVQYASASQVEKINVFEKIDTVIAEAAAKGTCPDLKKFSSSALKSRFNQVSQNGEPDLEWIRKINRQIGKISGKNASIEPNTREISEEGITKLLFVYFSRVRLFDLYPNGDVVCGVPTDYYYQPEEGDFFEW